MSGTRHKPHPRAGWRPGSLHRSVEIRRAAPLGNGRPLHRCSAAARVEQRRWAKSTALTMAASGGLCVIRVAGVCTHWAMDGHHLLPRGRGGNSSTTESRPTCRACHDWIGEHPAQAAALGHVSHSWEGGRA